MFNKEYNSAIEERTYDIFSHATGSRCRNFFMILGVNFPDDKVVYHESSLFSEFMRIFVQDLERNGCGDVYYLAVRERDTSQHGHHHVFFLLNGKVTQSIYGHVNRAKELWSSVLRGAGPYSGKGEGLINYRDPSEGNGIMLRTDDPNYHAKVMNCIDQSKYLAEAATKEPFGNRGRCWGSTKGIPSRYD